MTRTASQITLNRQIPPIPANVTSPTSQIQTAERAQAEKRVQG